MLKNRIKSLINLIKNTEIEEIEVSSFWGAQKIRLSKNKPIQTAANTSENEPVSVTNIDSSESSSENIIELEADKKVDKPLEQKDNEVVNEAETKTTEDINCYEIKAPLVGTFYSSAKPSDPPFVNVGDKITKGQIICIIEAMKIFNDIESDISGIVHEVCAENGSPVEYDQVIIKILPE